jgi:hypothetical protein
VATFGCGGLLEIIGGEVIPPALLKIVTDRAAWMLDKPGDSLETKDASDLETSRRPQSFQVPKCEASYITPIACDELTCSDRRNQRNENQRNEIVNAVPSAGETTKVKARRQTILDLHIPIRAGPVADLKTHKMNDSAINPRWAIEQGCKVQKRQRSGRACES